MQSHYDPEAPCTALYKHKEVAYEKNATPLGRDLSCSLAGDRTYTSQLPAYSRPVYVIEAGRGAGTIVTETALATGSNNIRYNRVDVFGHIDHWANDAHQHFVERPILDWLDTVVFP